MREFETGATRDSDDDKLDFEGYLNPLVLERFALYMRYHQKQADGRMRTSDNWQKGMTKDAYIKSGLRHVHDWWMEHRGYQSREGLQDALCAVIFNVMGYLLEDLRAGPEQPIKHDLDHTHTCSGLSSGRVYLAESESDKSYYKQD